MFENYLRKGCSVYSFSQIATLPRWSLYDLEKICLWEFELYAFHWVMGWALPHSEKLDQQPTKWKGSMHDSWLGLVSSIKYVIFFHLNKSSKMPTSHWVKKCQEPCEEENIFSLLRGGIMSVYICELWIQIPWAWVFVPPLISCVILGKIKNILLLPKNIQLPINIPLLPKKKST